MQECREMEEHISKLPPGILKLLSPRLAKKIAKLICTYDRYISFSFIFSSWRPLVDIFVYKAVFRSVLTRFVEKIDTKLVTDKLVSAIIVENLDSVPGLLELHVHSGRYVQSGLLADMIHHLKNLHIFKYPSDCTDEIIAALQRHCPHLTELDFAGSPKVTNASIQPLRGVRKLKFLNLERTRIDDEHYGLLLSELPNIANITFEHKEASILRHISWKDSIR
jgi:hypothetical protein